VLFERLRAETRQEHELAERAAPIPQTVPALAGQLQRLLRFYRAWEPEVERRLPPGLLAWWPGAWRTAALERDLAALRTRPLVIAESPALPDLGSAAAVVGSLYVVEGSALGGQVIASALETSLGISSANGASFFKGRGPATMPHWRGFMMAAGALVPPELHDDAIGAAKATFRAFMECVAEPQTVREEPQA
jgi:heme oxygenase